MKFFKWQHKRAVEVNALGERRIYWTIEAELGMAFAVGFHFSTLFELGRLDRLTLFIGPIFILVERAADARYPLLDFADDMRHDSRERVEQ